jgi:hypothetical protein
MAKKMVAGVMYALKRGTVSNQGKYKYAVPADYADGCWMGDCWIVDIDGNVHPEYNVSPIPLHADSLGEVVGVWKNCQD